MSKDTDDDGLGSFPSAASPLSAMGIDPDEARANPDLMARLTRGPAPAAAAGQARTLPADPHATRSAVMAGTSGGAGAPAPDPTDTGNAALTQTLASATKTANAIPTSDPETTALTAKQKELSQREPLYDPQTGKMLEGDKPSTGQKVWRGVRSGLVGFATGGIPGAIVGAVEPGDIRGGQAYGAPNPAYQRREQAREQALAGTNTALDTARANWKQALEASKDKGTLLKDTATAANDLVRGGTASELNDIKSRLVDVAKQKETDQKEATLEKIQNDLENKSRALDLRQMSIEQQGRIQDLANQLRETKMQNDKDKFVVGTDSKSLEAERKGRLAAIEDDWKAHPYINKLFGDKNKEIGIVNNDINSRLSAAGVNTGTPAASSTAPPPQKGFTRIKASDGSLHDVPTRRLGDAKKRDPRLEVVGGQ